MYYIVYGLLYTISLLPLKVLYLFSDVSCFILYSIIGYRKQVVFSNLKQAFPEKTDEERKKIAKKFYRNFTDSFIETIKLVSAGEKFIVNHFSGDFSVVNDLYKNHDKCQLHSAHNFNWEYANLSIPLHLEEYKLLTVYMPVSNKIFDRFFIKLRGKTGAILLPATKLRNTLLPYRHEKYALALVADQNPGSPASSYWLNFFGKPTPFVKAPESGARRGNSPVVFCHFRKDKRGFYTIHFKLADEYPAASAEGELTKKYVSFLEEIIQQQPENYLWSHRRWKWEWKEEYGKIIS